MKIRTLFVPLKEVKTIKPTGSVRSGYSYVQTYNDEAVKAQAQEFITNLDKRLASFTLRPLPDYTPHTSGLGGYTDRLSPLRHNLYMSIRRLFVAYATKNWPQVATNSVHLNTHWLAYHIAVVAMSGSDTVVSYYDGENVAHRGNFIAPRERTVFGKRKKALSK